MKNAKIMATIVAVFFSILLTGTANAGGMTTEKGGQVWESVANYASFQTSDCEVMNIMVEVKNEIVWRSAGKFEADFDRMAMAKVDSYDLCNEFQQTEELAGYASIQEVTYFKLWGHTIVKGTVTVSNKDGTEQHQVVFSTTLIKNKQGYEGFWNIDSGTTGPDQYIYRNSSQETWADAKIVDGVVSFRGIDYRDVTGTMNTGKGSYFSRFMTYFGGKG